MRAISHWIFHGVLPYSLGLWGESGDRKGQQCLPTYFIDLPIEQNGRHFPDDIFKCNFMNEKFCVLIQISLKFVPKGSINNIPVLVQIMAWCRPGNKPSSEPMVVSLLTHICVTQPQWIKPDWIWVIPEGIQMDVFYEKKNICILS